MSDQEIITLVSMIVPLVFYVGSLFVQRIYSKLPPQQHQQVGEVAQMAVAAVEQSMPLLEGVAKKQQATQIIVDILAAMGVKGVSATLVDTAIEAAVHSLNSQGLSAATARIPVIQTVPYAQSVRPPLPAQPQQ